jgi:DNA primase
MLPRKEAHKPLISFERRVEIQTFFARSCLLKASNPDTHPAFEYLQRRGISQKTALDSGLGYVGNYQKAQQGFPKIAPKSELRAAGLWNEKGNLCFYKHRLLFPYWLEGRVYGLQARNISWSKKLDGSKELLAGPVHLPFNADVLLTNPGQVFIAEGVIDCLSLLELGLPAVGIPGAGGFKPEWVKLFVDVEEIIVVLDNDEEGRNGTKKIVSYFASAGRSVKVCQLPSVVKDVNEYLNRS